MASVVPVAAAGHLFSPQGVQVGISSDRLGRLVPRYSRGTCRHQWQVGYTCPEAPGWLMHALVVAGRADQSPGTRTTCMGAGSRWSEPILRPPDSTGRCRQVGAGRAAGRAGHSPGSQMTCIGHQQQWQVA